MKWMDKLNAATDSSLRLKGFRARKQNIVFICYKPIINTIYIRYIQDDFIIGSKAITNNKTKYEVQGLPSAFHYACR